MIRTFRNAALQRLYETGQTRGLPQNMVARLQRRLFDLSVAPDADYMRANMPPGQRFHALQGDRAGYYAINVTGNWRLIFRFEDGDVWDVDLVDYH